MSALAESVQGDVLSESSSEKYTIDSTVAPYLQKRFNVTRDELTVENLQKFRKSEWLAMAEKNGLEFASDEELREDFKSFKATLGLD